MCNTVNDTLRSVALGDVPLLQQHFGPLVPSSSIFSISVLVSRTALAMRVGLLSEELCMSRHAIQVRRSASTTAICILVPRYLVPGLRS